MRVASGPAAPKQIEEIQAQEVTIPTIKPKEAGYGEHFQYVLQSKKGEKSEPKEKEKVQRSKLSWTEENLGDAHDLARMKEYLMALQESYENDP